MSDDSDLEDVLGTQVPAAGSRSPAGKSKGATSDKAKTPKLDKELSTVSEVSFVVELQPGIHLCRSAVSPLSLQSSFCPVVMRLV